MQKINLLHFGAICSALLLIVAFMPVPKVSAGTSVLWHNRNNMFEPGQWAYSAGYALLTDRSKELNLATYGQQITISLGGATNLIGHFGGSNYLGVGMVTTSFDNTYGGIDAIDYGWSYVAYFNDTGGPYLNMECWRVGEYYGGDLCLLSDGYYDPSIHMYDDITLKMEWAGSSVVFSVQAGLTNKVVNTFSTADKPTMSHYFEVGWVKNGYPILGGPDVKYFQFAGAWSTLMNPGPDLNWNTRVTNPKFMLTNETFYRSVSIAYTTVSIDSYLDNGWRWGGDAFDDVEISAGVDTSPFGVILQEWMIFTHWANDHRNTGSGVLLWYISPLRLAISIGSGSGSVQPYTGTKTYTYSTYVTVTASPASGYYFHHWLLQTSTGSWQLMSATYSLCMNADYSLTAYFVAIPTFYISSISSYGYIGTGRVINPNNLVGSSNDGNYAELYAGNPGDSAWAYANMNTAATGHVYVYGYSKAGYTSHLVTSVYDGQTWITISDQMLQPKSSPYSIDCGSITSYFTQIKFYVDFHNGYSADILMDAVHVIGASENIVSSINSQGHSSGGAVNNPNYLIGYNDGLYTHLHASNYGDYAWIVGNMNTPAVGHVYVYGYSQVSTNGGYVSHLVVSVSSNGYTWVNIVDKMISPTSGPYYIDCGSTTYSFNYIKFYVDYHNGYSAGLNIDAVHVLS